MKKELALVVFLVLGIVYLIIWQDFSWQLALVSIAFGCLGTYIVQIFRRKTKSKE